MSEGLPRGRPYDDEELRAAILNRSDERVDMIIGQAEDYFRVAREERRREIEDEEAQERLQSLKSFGQFITSLPHRPK